MLTIDDRTGFVMKWFRRAGIIAIFFILVGTFSLFTYQKFSKNERNIPSLLNLYYRFKDTEPWKAKEALELILAQEPSNQVALRAKAYWYIQQGDTNSALKFLKEQSNKFPKDAFFKWELAKLYINLKKKQKAEPLIKHLLSSRQLFYQNKAKELYQKRYLKNEHLKTPPRNVGSYIEPIGYLDKYNFDVLYERAQQVLALNPELAYHYLEFILSVDPNAKKAYLQLGYIDLKRNQYNEALKKFQQAYRLKPDASIAAQIGFILVKMKNYTRAQNYFEYSLAHGDFQTKLESRRAMEYLKRLQSQVFSGKPFPSKLSLKEKLLINFYDIREKNPELARKILHRLIVRYPKDILILKEAAYFESAQKQDKKAISYWKRVYNIDAKAEYALSIAYLYDRLNDGYHAFYYFHLASKTTDFEIKYKAEIAMSNLAGAETKYLPEPLFVEIYAAPFYFSRFNLGVFPLVGRAGVTLNKKHRTDAYFSYRRTQDNRSGQPDGLLVQASISQIFEDNVAIYAGGLRTYPWPKFPMQVFLEVGRAEDLIPRNRPTWRDDIRGGLVYYNRWGVKPTYTFNLTFPWKWVAPLYWDIIYYSRFNNNIIGTAFFRPGFRIMTYKSAQVDAYLANYLILDKNHEFYNNTYTVGPGLSIQPNNRLNVKLRFEALQSYYIPVNSPNTNPFGSKYYNNVAMLETFLRF